MLSRILGSVTYLESLSEHWIRRLQKIFMADFFQTLHYKHYFVPLVRQG